MLSIICGVVISTGTPIGVGARLDPPELRSNGDIVEAEVPGVGIPRNDVATESV